MRSSEIDGEFVERLPAPPAIRALGLVELVVAGVAAAAVLRALEAGRLPLAVALSVWVVGLAPAAVGCWLLRAGISTRVTAGRVTLAIAPVWRTHLRVADLDIQVTAVSPARWGGVGLRRGFAAKRKTQRALLVGTGPALLLTDRTTGISYTVQTRNKEAFLAALTYEDDDRTVKTQHSCPQRTEFAHSAHSAVIRPVEAFMIGLVAHGRRAHIRRLISRLDRPPLVPVVGLCGCGREERQD